MTSFKNHEIKELKYLELLMLFSFFFFYFLFVLCVCMVLVCLLIVLFSGLVFAASAFRSSPPPWYHSINPSWNQATLTAVYYMQWQHLPVYTLSKTE